MKYEKNQNSSGQNMNHTKTIFPAEIQILQEIN